MRSTVPEAPATRNVYVAGLPLDMTDGDVRAHFSRFGPIEIVKIMFDKQTNRSRGYGFLLFASANSAAAAIEACHKTIVRGSTVSVRLSHETSAPRLESVNSAPAAAASHSSTNVSSGVLGVPMQPVFHTAVYHDPARLFEQQILSQPAYLHAPTHYFAPTPSPLLGLRNPFCDVRDTVQPVFGSHVLLALVQSRESFVAYATHGAVAAHQSHFGVQNRCVDTLSVDTLSFDTPILSSSCDFVMDVCGNGRL